MKLPKHFNGNKFRKIHGENIIFWEDGKNEFYCPSLPNLTKEDLRDCIILPTVNSYIGKTPNELTEDERNTILFSRLLDENGRFR